MSDSPKSDARPSAAPVPAHSPRHTRQSEEQPAVGKIQGRWMNPPSQGSIPSRPVLVSMYDDDDFLAVHKKPGCEVVCPFDGCGTSLTAKTNKQGTRWLATRPGSTPCDHHVVPLELPAGGGGLETAEHKWMKNRIARVCTVIGHDAFIEHQPTHADVFLPDFKIAIEYQRWDTKFAARNIARTHAGAEATLWFFPEPSTKQTGTALGRLITTRVYQHGGIYLTPRHRSKRLNKQLVVQRPWQHPEDREMNRTTRLFVSGSIVTYDSESNGLKYAGSYGLDRFLGEIVRGERTLQNAVVRIRQGVARKRVWVLVSDQDKIAAVKKAAADQRARQAWAVRVAASEKAGRESTARADERHALAQTQPGETTHDPQPLAAPEKPAPQKVIAPAPMPQQRSESLWERVKKAFLERWR